MKRLHRLQRAVIIFLGGAAIVPTLAARNCGGNGDVAGSFGWLGIRTSDFVTSVAIPPGTVLARST